MTLRGIAAHDLHYAPAQMAALIAKGFEGDADERQAALYAIGFRSGIMMYHTDANLAAWKTNRSVLQAFRGRVEQIMISDPDQFVREAAVLAFAGLSMRPEDGKWLTELSDQDVAFLIKAFHQESFGGARADIMRLIVGCRTCPTSNLEARQQLMRQAVYDAAQAVVEQALYGAGHMKIADMLDFVVSLLKHEDPNLRSTAARAVMAFGREAARYRGAVVEALSQEKSADMRGIMEGAIAAIDGAEVEP